MPEQLWHVLASLAERRHVYAYHVQPMKQVFAELPTRHTRFEILVRGRDYAHVDSDRELSTDPVELAFRQDT
jgi:hypothetical protein